MFNFSSQRPSLKRISVAVNVNILDSKHIDAIHKTFDETELKIKSELTALHTIKNASSVMPMAPQFSLGDFNLALQIPAEKQSVYKIVIQGSALTNKSLLPAFQLGASAAAATIVDLIYTHLGLKTSYQVEINQYNDSVQSLADLSLKSYKCGVIVCSDSISSGVGTDKSGVLIKDKLLTHNQTVLEISIVPDTIEAIHHAIKTFETQGCDFIFITGGTGFSPRDRTTKAVLDLIDKRAYGVEQAIRHYGDQRLHLAMLSNAVAGLFNDCLIVTMPGSTGGVKDSLNAIIPMIFHVPHIVQGGKH